MNLILLLLILGSSVIGDGQEKRPKPALSGGTVSGKVFAITEGGDIKPARLAKIYLFYCYRSVKYADAHPEDEKNSACHIWMDRKNNQQDQYNKELEQHNREAIEEKRDDWSDSLVCTKELLVYHEALSGTLKWIDNENKSWQVIAEEADEEGAFKIAVPRAGIYKLLVLGQAGFNEAVWEADDITVSLGLETKVKLSSPKEACLVMQ